MRPQIQFEFDPHAMMLLPLVAVLSVQCQNPSCGEYHGWAICVGWLCWTVVLHFDTDHPNE